MVSDLQLLPASIGVLLVDPLQKIQRSARVDLSHHPFIHPPPAAGSGSLKGHRSALLHLTGGIALSAR